MLALTPARTLTSADLKDNLHDIQDNVVAPILMRYGRHIFLKFNDGAKARAWLRNMFKRVNARPKEHGTCFTVNIGFTYEGLKALGLSNGRWTASPRRSGSACGAVHMSWAMSDRTRRNIGKAASAVPTFTRWVGFEPTPTKVAKRRCGSFAAEMEATGGVEIRFVQDTMALAHENGIGSEGEHFGFADPISQPPIEGADTPSYPGDGVLEEDGTWRPLKPGEFLLGYEDEAGPDGTQVPEPFELRLNGTYMVFRKLYQDVAAFRRYLATAAKALYGSDDHYHQELVAAKMMGRWRSGCPVDLSPDKDDPAIAADPQRRNNFTYAGDDQGLRCPLGSHLRRSNPRATPLKRATAVRRHRLIRRGVEYGPHLPDGVLEDDGVDRGLINLFIQADIERQFEFVQKEWMKGGEFIGLDPNEQDPINGVGGEGSQMVVPGAKRPFLFDLPTFVRVKAGEYLFVPGLNALEGLIEQKF